MFTSMKSQDVYNQSKAAGQSFRTIPVENSQGWKSRQQLSEVQPNPWDKTWPNKQQDHAVN